MDNFGKIFKKNIICLLEYVQEKMNILWEMDSVMSISGRCDIYKFYKIAKLQENNKQYG